MKCRSCTGPAVVEVRRNNAAFCSDCFGNYVRGQVDKAISRFRMLEPGDRVLVAVSGGKDSLALWDVLLGMGYDAVGLYLGLGIGEYSDRSGEIVRSFADTRSVELVEVDLEQTFGFDIPTAGSKGSRSTCAVCGLSKRYVFNRAAAERGFDVVATGHNLDDEAATLLGNTLRWQTEFIGRQHPALPARPANGGRSMVRRIKPLHRLSEHETAAYAFLQGIDYVVEECPLVAGNTQLKHKDAMNAIERNAPGTKSQFFLGFLDRAAPLFRAEEDPDLVACSSCGQLTTGRFCAFCRARAQILRLRLPERDAPDDEQALAAELSDEVLPAEFYGERAGAGP
ncbi:MAG: ATP-binding protein [Actinomycetota bacterium]